MLSENKIFHLLFLSVLLSASLFGQGDSSTQVKPFAPVDGSAIDTVSLTNGALNVAIPIISWPQRGGDLKAGVSLEYSGSNGWALQPSHIPGAKGTVVWRGQGVFFTWRMSGVVRGHTSFTDYNGITYDTYTANDMSRPSAPHRLGSTSPGVYETIDGSGIRCDPTGCTTPDGVKSPFPSNPPGPMVVDRNGNELYWTSTTTLVDTMGRIIMGFNTVANSAPCPAGSTSGGEYDLPGVNGGSFPVVICFGRFTANTAFQLGAYKDSTDTAVLMNAAVLPDGSSYKFNYDGYFNLSSITLPTGGTITYTWANTTTTPGVCNGSFGVGRVVTSRAENDGNDAKSWIYNWGNLVNQGATATNIITDPQQNDTVITVSNLGDSGCTYYETERKLYQGSSASGTLLKTVDTGYTPNLGDPYAYITGTHEGSGILPASVTTTLPNGSVTKVVTTYDSTGDTFYDENRGLGHSASQGTLPLIYGRVLSVSEYDFGSGSAGSLLRKTVNTYLWQNNSTYKTLNLLDPIASTIVQDGNGNRLAETDYGFDESSLQPSGVTTQFVAPADSTHRGNRTSTSRWLNITGALLKSTTTFFDTGMPSQTTDALGNTTRFGYSSTFDGAYLTQTTLPGTGGVQHVTSANYDFNTGLLTSLTDQNGQVFNYHYDNMLRMTESDRPDGGKTTFSYPNPTTVERQRTINSSSHDDFIAYMDGLGRMTHSQVLTPSGTVRVDNTYDPYGRVLSVTNPFYSTSDATYGVTQMQYDALGRVNKTTKPDGSIASDQYTANCVTSTDPAGKVRKSCVDGSGRLIEVDEFSAFNTINGTPGSGSVTISGSEHSQSGIGAHPGTPGTATVTFYGEQQCAPDNTICDSGNIAIDVNGGTVGLTYWPNGSCTGFPVSYLANTINQYASNPVTAAFNGISCGTPAITLTAKTVGANTNYPLRPWVTYDNTDSCTDGNGNTLSPCFTNPSITPVASGPTLTGGTDAFAGNTVYDAGSCTVVISGTSYSASFGQGSTTSSIAAALASAINGGSLASASASGATIAITAKAVGTTSNYSLSGGNCSFNSSIFSGPSFVANPSGSNLSGGSNGSIGPANPFVTLYSYDALNNLLSVTQKGDPSVTPQSQWRVRTFTYDSLGHLLTANHPESGKTSYSYDADGNMTTKTDARGVTTTVRYDALNRVTSNTYSDGTPAATYQYDQGCCGVTPTNAVGRMTAAFAGNTELVFSYDPLGRITTQWDCPPSGIQRGYCYVILGLYDQAGNLTSLTYPSSRTVTSHYNSANWLDQVQFVRLNGQNVNFNYWSADDTNFYSTGTPKSWTLGNGVTESTTLNNRLQLQQEVVSNPNVGTFSNHSYNYGTQNNGNVLSAIDNLQSAYTQNFSYDALNRLASATESRWGLNLVYDAWDNRLQQNVVAGSAVQTQFTVNGNNQLNGFSYDAAGDLLNDGTHSYSFDSENRVSKVDGGNVQYIYNAEGNRVRKDVTGSPSTEYFYFAGNIISEYNVNAGAWSDYVFTSGKRIARTSPTTVDVRFTNDSCSGCGGTAVGGGDRNLFVNSITVGSTVITPSDPSITFTSGPCNRAQNNVGVINCNGDIISSTSASGQSVTVNAYGSPDYNVYPHMQLWVNGALAGEWDITGSAQNYTATVSNAANTAAEYYHGDQIGSSRLMTSFNGYPVWQATFLPFGEEYNPQTTTNHYKFTGKERDAESNLDSFGARYYSSSLGRFTTVDPVTVNAARMLVPHRLNLYAYAANSPTVFVDPTGAESLPKSILDAATNLDSYSHNYAAQQVQDYLNGKRGFVHENYVSEAAAAKVYLDDLQSKGIKYEGLFFTTQDAQGSYDLALDRLASSDESEIVGKIEATLGTWLNSATKAELQEALDLIGERKESKDYVTSGHLLCGELRHVCEFLGGLRNLFPTQEQELRDNVVAMIRQRLRDMTYKPPDEFGLLEKMFEMGLPQRPLPDACPNGDCVHGGPGSAPVLKIRP
jgi:RHS repeat-associated protein